MAELCFTASVDNLVIGTYVEEKDSEGADTFCGIYLQSQSQNVRPRPTLVILQLGSRVFQKGPRPRRDYQV